MAQYQSQLGQLGFARQAVPGTPATLAAGAPSRWLKLRKSSMGADRSLLIPDPEIQSAGGRDVPKPYLGPASFNGTYEFYVRSEALPLALYGALGGGGAAPTGSALLGYVHTFTPADTLPIFTLQEQLGNGFDTMLYADSIFNSLHLEAAATGFLMGNVGAAALTQVAGGAATASPTFDSTVMYVGSKISVTLNAVSIPAASFSFDLTNNVEQDHFVLGSLTPDALTPKRRDVTGNFTLRPTSNALFRQAAFGAAASTSVTGVPTVQQMVITCTTYEIITGATSQVYTTTITLPEVTLVPFKPEANQDDVIEHSIDFRVSKIAAANAVSIAVTNGVATAYNT